MLSFPVAQGVETCGRLHFVALVQEYLHKTDEVNSPGILSLCKSAVLCGLLRKCVTASRDLNPIPTEVPSQLAAPK